MRQHHRVHRRVRQVETAAQRVAQLVVQRHRDSAEHRAAQPGAVQRIAARVDTGRIGAQHRQRTRERGDSLGRHQVHDRIRIHRIQPFGRVRNRIDAARHAHLQRQSERQFGVVDHRARQHAHVAPGLLQPALGDAVDRRHLRAGIRGGDRQDGQRGRRRIAEQRDGLAQAGGRAATDGDGAIGAQPRRFGERLACGRDRHVHGGTRKDASRARSEQVGDALRLVRLLGRREHERPARAEPVDLGTELRERPGAEHDARGMGGIDEGAGLFTHEFLLRVLRVPLRLRGGNLISPWAMERQLSTQRRKGTQRSRRTSVRADWYPCAVHCGFRSAAFTTLAATSISDLM